MSFNLTNTPYTSVGRRKPKPYPCLECGLFFGSRMELAEHNNSHTGERPFHCPTCFMTFTRRSTLWNHKRVHNKLRPFACRFCGVMFKWKNSLKCHQAMHRRRGPAAAGHLATTGVAFQAEGVQGLDFVELTQGNAPVEYKNLRGTADPVESSYQALVNNIIGRTGPGTSGLDCFPENGVNTIGTNGSGDRSAMDFETHPGLGAVDMEASLEALPEFLSEVRQEEESSATKFVTDIHRAQKESHSATLTAIYDEAWWQGSDEIKTDNDCTIIEEINNTNGVKIILEKKIVGDMVYYLVEWKAALDKTASWEPAVGLACDDLVFEFEREWHKRRRRMQSQEKAGRFGNESYPTPTNQQPCDTSTDLVNGFSAVDCLASLEGSIHGPPSPDVPRIINVESLRDNSAQQPSLTNGGADNMPRRSEDYYELDSGSAYGVVGAAAAGLVPWTHRSDVALDGAQTIDTPSVTAITDNFNNSSETDPGVPASELFSHPTTTDNASNKLNTNKNNEDSTIRRNSPSENHASEETVLGEDVLIAFSDLVQDFETEPSAAAALTAFQSALTRCHGLTEFVNLLNHAATFDHNTATVSDENLVEFSSGSNIQGGRSIVEKRSIDLTEFPGEGQMESAPLLISDVAKQTLNDLINTVCNSTHY